MNTTQINIKAANIKATWGSSSVFRKENGAIVVTNFFDTLKVSKNVHGSIVVEARKNVSGWVQGATFTGPAAVEQTNAFLGFTAIELAS